MKIHYDLNISEISKPIDVLRYVKCGYTRLAMNRVINVNEFTFETDNKKLSKDSRTNLRSRFEKRLAQPDLGLLIDDEVREATKKLGCELKIFSRLTLVASDLNQLTFFMREFLSLVRQFDILACEPRSSDVLSHAANNMTIELITFDLSNAISGSGSCGGINKHILDRCRDRAIGIEINLSAAIATTYGRVNTARFINELQLFRAPPAIFTVTSGAHNRLLIRNYLGLSCMLSTMGMGDKFVSVMCGNADVAVQRGLARKYTVHGSAAIIELGRKLPGVVSVKVVPSPSTITTTGTAATIPSPTVGAKRDITTSNVSNQGNRKSPKKKKAKCA